MQDRYAGDIGDFGKYGLLRALCSEDESGPALRLGVLWYRVPDENNGDGTLVEYLDSPDAGLRDCDAELFDQLRELVDGERSVAEVQARTILPGGTEFFEAETPTPLDKRANWVEDGLRAVVGAELVFADPDNGLREPSAKSGGLDARKHAYYDELKPCLERGQSLVIYQHTARQGSFEEQIATRREALRRHFDGAPGLMVLRWRRKTSRAYFIVPAPAHARALRAKVQSFVASPWGQRQRGYDTPHFELVEDSSSSPATDELSLRTRGSSTADLLAFAVSLADAADAIAMRHYRTEHAVERKDDGTFVTPADREIEVLLRERIAEAYPEHAVLGEEQGGDAAADAEARWIIDPIDGTHNFMRGVPIWATLIAVERDGRIEVGVVSAPALGTRWWAGRGLGAYRGATGGRAGAGERIHVSDTATLAEAQVMCGDIVSTLDRWPGTQALLWDAWRVRAPGDFWGFCLVAEGGAEVMLEGAHLYPWDLAPLIPIVEEAGGRLTDAEGGPLEGAGPVIASNGRLHDEVVRRLAGGNAT